LVCLALFFLNQSRLKMQELTHSQFSLRIETSLAILNNYLPAISSLAQLDINCFNLISFYGNDKVIEKVRKWNEELIRSPQIMSPRDCLKVLHEIFYSDVDNFGSIDLGSEIVIQDFESNIATHDQLPFFSLASPPNGLISRISSLLFKLDPNVVIENNIIFKDGSMGISYTALNHEGNHYFQNSFVPKKQFLSEDIYTSLERVHRGLLDSEVFILDYLMTDLPQTASVIKRFKPHLIHNFDWATYAS